VRILLIDYSSAFNIKLITKLRTLGQDIFLCNCILDFLMGRPQVLRVGNNTYIGHADHQQGGPSGVCA
jgi:hypothetical protein